jgi:hypothetical protein
MSTYERVPGLSSSLQQSAFFVSGLQNYIFFCSHTNIFSLFKKIFFLSPLPFLLLQTATQKTGGQR